MNPAWIGTLVATVVTVAIAMLALGLGLLFGRDGPEPGSCGRVAGGRCACTPGAAVCAREETAPRQGHAR